MTLPVSRLIPVSVSLSQPGALGRSFNNLLIVGDSNVIDGLERERTYQGLDGVAADFGTTAPEYLAADIYYQQKPKPINCTIGRWLRTATAAKLDGAILTVAQSALSLFTQITSGGFTVTVDGTVKNLTAMNFSTALNLNGVAATIQAAFSGAATCVWDGHQFHVISATNGAGTPAHGTMTFTGNPANLDTVTVNGTLITFVTGTPVGSQVLIGASAQATAANLNTFLINSVDANIVQATYAIVGQVVTATFGVVGTVGNAFTLVKSCANMTLSGATLSGGVNASSVSYATAPGAGQDVSTLMGLTAALALPLVPGYAAESPLQAVTALQAMDNNWYGIEFGASVSPSDDDFVAMAAFIEGLDVTRMLGITIQNTNVLSDVVTTDLASRLKALNYQQTFSVFCSSNPYAAGSVFGRLFTVNLAGSNTMIDIMYKQMPGIVAEDIDTTEANTLQKKRCNAFVAYDNNTSIIEYGVMAGPAFIDETFGDDALQNSIQTSVFNANYTSSTKVPQTDQGEATYVNAISQSCQQFVTNGFGAPGVWNADGFGSLVEGQFLKLGYYIYAPPIALQSQSDRAARKSVPFQVAFKEAGSNQTVQIDVTVNQ